MLSQFKILYLTKLVIYLAIPLAATLAKIYGQQVIWVVITALWLSILYDLIVCSKTRAEFVMIELVSQIALAVWVSMHPSHLQSDKYGSISFGIVVALILCISFLAHLFSGRLPKSEPEQ